MEGFDYTENLLEILEFGRHKVSTIKPSEWTEENRTMDSSVSRYKGKFSYDITPYTREIVDCLDPNHPARIIAVEKGAQIGFSTGVIEPGVGWIISQNPGNILFLTGHADLSEEAVTKIDHMIDSCGIRHLIRANTLRARSMKTGDTNSKKEFPGGSLVSGSAGNHKLLRQRSVMYGFIDDFDAAKKSTKQSGSTTKMIEQRFASYSDKMKLFYISTPELKQTSNIEPVYLLGDQRKYHVPCPCCKALIPLEWEAPMAGNDKEKGGIYWQLDENNKLIKESVGYKCQKCGGFFTDATKYEMNLAGKWIPTAEPSRQGYYSYHINSLYAPPGMYDWEHYVRQFLEANPPGGKQKEDLQKTFVNLCLGQTWEATGDAPKANDLQRNNLRPYEIGIIPEKISIKDGNGKIVMLTCACDLNGKEHDARLDWEIVAWSESGASYSIDMGNIGTFIFGEGQKKIKVDREHWTYEHGKSNSVWKIFNEVIGKIYETDTGRKMRIFLTGVDTGFCEDHATAFVERSNFPVVGLKGKDANKFIRLGADNPSFRKSKERNSLYLVEVNQIKDELAAMIKLKWDEGNDERQPVMFMNYPLASADGKYQYKNFFSHYEAEHRVVESKDGEGIASKWVKKSSIHQNHFWDVRVYNIALKDIMTALICQENKIKNYGWADYVNIILGRA